MRRWLIFVSCLLGLTALSVYADDAGTRSPFEFGVGARELALGGSAVSRCDAATAPYWNPSRLASAEQIGVCGFHCRLFDGDVAYQYLGLVIPTLDWGSIGFGVFRLGIAVSFPLNLPSGPVIILIAGTAYLLAASAAALRRR